MRGNIIALEADEHYINVFGSGGECKVLYRVGDAVRELDALNIGVRVHRSYWIAPSAIVELERADKRLFVKLANGMRVPVSQANTGVVRRMVPSEHIQPAPKRS